MERISLKKVGRSRSITRTLQRLTIKGQKDGDVIPPGTLLGYQGASGNTDSGVYGGPAYPHISLHVNGIGFKAVMKYWLILQRVCVDQLVP